MLLFALLSCACCCSVCITAQLAHTRVFIFSYTNTLDREASIRFAHMCVIVVSRCLWEKDVEVQHCLHVVLTRRIKANILGQSEEPFQGSRPFASHPRLKLRGGRKGSFQGSRPFVSHLMVKFRGGRSHSKHSCPFVSHRTVTFRGGWGHSKVANLLRGSRQKD